MNRSVNLSAGTLKVLRRLGAFSITLGIGSAVVCALAWKYQVFPGDAPGLVRIQSWNGGVFNAISAGTGTWQIVIQALVLAAFLFLLRKRLEAVFLIVSGYGGVVSIVLKWIINRPRPLPSDAATGTTFSGASFPSNHVVAYTVFVGFLIWLLMSTGLHPALKTSGAFLLLALIGLIDVSRIYDGAHWPSDVYGGSIIGLFLLGLLLLAYEFIKKTLVPESGGQGDIGAYPIE